LIGVFIIKCLRDEQRRPADVQGAFARSHMARACRRRAADGHARHVRLRVADARRTPWTCLYEGRAAQFAQCAPRGRSVPNRSAVVFLKRHSASRCLCSQVSCQNLLPRFANVHARLHKAPKHATANDSSSSRSFISAALATRAAPMNVQKKRDRFQKRSISNFRTSEA